ncbi:MAG: hypothetical protein HQ582_18325, partial [Planctomycetes bacterium]|nr:hypothetical protein [Planctomycetota bacterium]
AAAAWYLRQVAPSGLFHTVGGLALGTGVLVACSTADSQARLALNDWLSYHVLFTALATAGLIVLAVGLLGRNLRVAGQIDPNRPGSEPHGPVAFPARVIQAWVTGIGVAVVGLALVHSGWDPALPWWSARAILAVSVMAGVLAMWLRLPSYVFASALLVNVAGTLIWTTWEDPWTVSGFIHTNVLSLGLASCVWSLVGWTHPEGVPALDLGGRPARFAQMAVQIGLAQVGLLLMALLVAVAAVFNVTGIEHRVTDWLAWLALGTVAVAVAIQLWDPRTRFASPRLYFVALIAVGMGLDARALAPRPFCWNAAPELAGFTLVAVLVGLLLVRMKPVWRALRIADVGYGWESPWFSGTQAVVAGIAALTSVWISLDTAFDPLARPGLGWLWGRMVGPLSVFALLVTATLLARLSAGRWRAAWQYASLGVGTLVLAELGWALLPATAASRLNQTVVLMIAAVVSTLISGFGLGRVLDAQSDWLPRGRRCVAWLAGLALATLVAVLAQEAFLFDPEFGAPMALWAVLVVAGALVALILANLALALDRSRDPLDLSDRGRTVYVYVAEVLGGLVGLHLWLTMPWLFRLGIVEEYWMLIVMAVAFGGAGLSELFHRRGLPVLSEPLENTAVLLPLVPAILFWLPIVPAASGLGGASPAVWFMAALFYGVMAVTRRSKWWFSLLALGTANVGLWVLWHQQGLLLNERPQVWLIPVGLSALLAEYLNYDRLNRAQSSGLRYFALSLIYVPSTVEFLGNLGDSLWLPIVLTLLSLLGILAGIVLRVRSFVVLGLTFLVLVIVTLICHAAFAEHQMWILWIFLVSLGAAIMTLIALFERRREEILAAIARFRQWEPRRVRGVKDE